MNEIKPGYKTTEFWLSCSASIVGLLLASGCISAGGDLDRILGLAAATLTSLGYSAARSKTKAN